MHKRGMFDPLPSASRPPQPIARGEWVAIIPVLANAPPAPAQHPAFGAPAARYTYLGAAGELLGYVDRYATAAGKEFLPLTWCRHTASGAIGWRWKSWTPPRPLYGLDRLAARPNAPVIICEGEKAADAVSRLLPEHVAVTSPHGSKSASKADWSQLRGRSVTIWPDADAAGLAYAKAVAKHLAGHSVASQIMVPPADARDGWDAADAETEGWDTARVLALLGRAQPAAEASNAAPLHRDRILRHIEDAELWSDLDGEAFATVPVGGHRENLPIADRAFKRWLISQCFAAGEPIPGGQALDDAIRVIEATAIFNGPRYRTWRRVGMLDGRIYLDLGSENWSAVEVTAQGWQLCAGAPCKFIRSSSMRALPAPIAGVMIEGLRPFLNVASDAEFRLIVAWLIAAIRPCGPYPVLAISGVQGSSKSTVSRVVRALIDPNAAPLRAPPRDERDLFIASWNSHVLAFDNLSSLPTWLADALCRFSTGGGFATRELHSDRREVIFEAQRPILLNGIPDLAERPDLGDRTLRIMLGVIEEGQRLPEGAFWQRFDAVAPGILGALLDGVSAGLRHLGRVRLDRLPRMADFALWIEAASPGLGWQLGEFAAIYEANRVTSATAAFEASSLAQVLYDFVESMTVEGWEGTATELLEVLSTRATESVRRSRHWPDTPAALGAKLLRLAPVLQAVGVEIEKSREGKIRWRRIQLRRSVSTTSDR